MGHKIPTLTDFTHTHIQQDSINTCYQHMDYILQICFNFETNSYQEFLEIFEICSVLKSVISTILGF